MNLISRIMLHCKPYGGAFFHELRNTSNTGLNFFCLLLLEKWFLPFTNVILNTNSGVLFVCLFVFKSSPTSLSSWDYFLFPLAFIQIIFRNNNIWVQGQHCQSFSCKITPGLTSNYRWQVGQITWGKTKTKDINFSNRFIWATGVYEAL